MLCSIFQCLSWNVLCNKYITSYVLSDVWILAGELGGRKEVRREEGREGII